MIKGVLSKLLWIANAGRHQAFYPVKDRILKRFATPDGFDLQLFRCWGCWCEDCPSYDESGSTAGWCGGSGTHRGYILDRFKLGSRVFHRPRYLPASWGKPKYSAPPGVMGERNRIDGRTTSACESMAVSYRSSAIAAALLAIVFGPKGSAAKIVERPACLLPFWRHQWHWSTTRRVAMAFNRALPRRCNSCETTYCRLWPCRCGLLDDIPF